MCFHLTYPVKPAEGSGSGVTGWRNGLVKRDWLRESDRVTIFTGVYFIGQGSIGFFIKQGLIFLVAATIVTPTVNIPLVYIHILRTHMTLLLIGKGLVLES